MRTQLRTLLVALLVAGCGKPSKPETSAAAPPAASVAPPAVSSAAPVPEPPRLGGRVVRIEPGKEPEVVLSAPSGELRLRGVDGKALAWKPGDEVVVDGPKPEAGTIDCSDAARCSVGLRTGGDVVLRDIDAHSAIPLMARLGADVMLVGPSRRASALEVRAPSTDALVRSLAAAFGLGVRRHRKLALLARPDTLATLKLRRVPVPSHRVDLELVGAELANVTHLFSEIARTPLTGELRGELSVAARDLDSGAALDACLALCGVDFERKGRGLALHQTGAACTEHSVPEPRCPRSEARPTTAVDVRLACVAPSRLRVLALAFPPGRDPVVVLGEGAPRGDELALRKGAFLGQSELVKTASGTVQINWQVAEITRERVELVLADETRPELKPKRIQIPAK